MANPRPRSTGEIIDHPAFENYETLQRLSEPFTAILAAEPEFTAPELWEQLITGDDVFDNVPNDRFLVHEPDLVLEDGPDEDPLENQDGYVSDEGSESDLEIDAMLEHRREHHRHILISHGFEPEPSSIVFARSADLFAGTSLEAPEPLPSAEDGPEQCCRAQRAEELTFRGLTPGALQEFIEEERSEHERIHELELDLEGCERRFQSQKSQLPGVKARVLDLAEEWRVKDAQAYAKWHRHFVSANNASESPCRIFQMLIFYTQGVPDDLFEAVRELAGRELVVSAYDLDCKRVLADLGDIEEDACYCSDHIFPNDDYWNHAAERKTGLALYFGNDYEHDLPNGFGDYLSQGREGVALAQHIMANIETRRICVEHSVNLDERDEDFESDQTTTAALRAKFFNFTVNAQKVVNKELHKLLGDDFVSSNPGPEETEQSSADVKALKDVKKALANACAEVGLPQDDSLADLDV